MRILLLTQIIPYPPDAGPRVKTWHVLRYLRERGHEVILASFVRPEEEEYIPTVQAQCEAVFTVPIYRSKMGNVFYLFKSYITGRPYLIERDDLRDMRLLIQRILATEQIDVIHADQLTMAQFAFSSSILIDKAFPPRNARNQTPEYTSNSQRAGQNKPICVFDAHNAVWSIVERMGQNASKFMQPVVTVEAKRIKRYEGKVVANYDYTLAVTEVDRLALLQAVDVYRKSENQPNKSLTGNRSDNGMITVIPIAVDTIQLQPIDRLAGSKNIVTMGTLHYPPNADGIRWFVREVFPLVLQQAPEATLTIIGKNPPEDLLELSSKDPQKVIVTGFVPELKPYFEKSALMVVPVRAGSGMRVRILEAFSQAIPVITTTVGLEGIDAKPGVDVLVADTPQEFSSAVINLMMDETLQRRLAENGRALAASRYDWRTALSKLDEIYSG